MVFHSLIESPPVPRLDRAKECLPSSELSLDLLSQEAPGWKVDVHVDVSARITDGRNRLQIRDQASDEAGQGPEIVETEAITAPKCLLCRQKE